MTPCPCGRPARCKGLCARCYQQDLKRRAKAPGVPEALLVALAAGDVSVSAVARALGWTVEQVEAWVYR